MITTNGTAPRRLRIIVLAAGFSARLGRSKALTRIHGKTLLRRTVELTAPLTRHAVIVVAAPRPHGYRHELRRQRVLIVSNRHRAEGMSSSLRCGLKAARFSSAVLLLPVDLVELRTRDLRMLITRSLCRPRCVVARRLRHAAGGTPVVLPHWLYRAAQFVDGDQGLRGFLRELPPALLELVTLPSAGPDLDTVADLAKARQNRRVRSD